MLLDQTETNNNNRNAIHFNLSPKHYPAGICVAAPDTSQNALYAYFMGIL